MGYVSILATAFYAGLIHVVSGPDHLAAIAPFSAERAGRPWAAGFLWGLGHSSAVFVLGIAAMAFQDQFSIQTVSAWSERLIGATLIWIGIWGIRKVFSKSVHIHKHNHDSVQHRHIHLHRTGKRHTSEHHHTHAPFWIGLLHGFAGTSHLIGIIPVLWIHQRGLSLSYLIAYGVGSIATMTFFSSGVRLLSERISISGYRRMMTGLSAVAIAIGFFWILSAA